MKRFEKILPWLKNKYIITMIVFVVWMIFFDRNDLISQYSYRQELKKLEIDKEYYIKEIEENKKNTFELTSDPENLEKFARETYRMKKDDEDIFMVIAAEDKSQLAEK
ncbi:MAG TPA: septum formation initiator family protein [Bacteroidia bacterium]|nr:septum formation initiator family protein [Bacteroidia bacterium]